MTKAGEIYYDIKIKDNGFNAQIGRYDKKMENLDKKGQKAADSLGKIGSKPINTSSISAADQKLQALGTRLENTGKRMTSVGKRMSVGFTAPIVAGMAVSTKAYMKFDEKVTEINSLLRESGETAQESSKRYAKVYDYAQKSSVKYGVASEQVTNGMEEMVKKGYNLNQTMASMPAIFDASRASGDKFETVMSVTTSTLEQFGMISKDTNKQMEYTNKVADVLTYVADKTAAGFTDMGYAMQYIGPTAKSMGYSLTDTAAAIGLLSNRGIEGEKAGTGLRGMLSSLLKPSKKAQKAMDDVGLSLVDNKGKMKSLPRLIDDINKSTKGMQTAQKNAFLTMIFGREPMSAVNSLLDAGGDKLRKYSKAADRANGYTKQVADNMRKAKKFGVDQFKAGLEALEQNVGKQLMPALTPAIEWANKMIDNFSKLSGEQQQNILKWAGITAAIGPTLTIGGKFVSLGSGIVKTIDNINRASKVLSAGEGMGAATKTLFGYGKASQTVAKDAQVAASATTKLGKAGSMIPMALGPAGAAVGVFGALLAGGLVYWELWGKKQAQSSERTAKWGSDVGSSADKALTNFKKFSDESGTAISNLDKVTEKSAKNIKKNLDGMVNEIQIAGDESLRKQKAAIEKLPKSMQEDANKRLETVQAENAKRVELAEKASNTIAKIDKKHLESGKKLTADEYAMRIDAQKQLTNLEVNQMDLSAKKKKGVMIALNDEIESMNKKQLQNRWNDLNDAGTAEEKLYKKQSEALKTVYKNDKVGYQEALTKLNKTHANTRMSLAMAEMKLLKKQGDYEGVQGKIFKKSLKEWGLNYEQVEAEIDKRANALAKSNDKLAHSTSDMSDKMVDANQRWNSLVFDEKTGKVKTNAVEEIAKASTSKKGWDNLKFIIKNANLSSNAKSIMTDALVQNGKWNNLSFKEKKLLTTYKGSRQVMNALRDMKQWNDLTPKQQAMIAKAKTKGQLVKALKDMKLWDKFPEKTKRLIADGKDIKKKTDKAKKDVDSVNNKKVKMKYFKGDAKDVANAMGKGVAAIIHFNNTNPKTQHAMATTNAAQFASEVNSMRNKWGSLSFAVKTARVVGQMAGSVVNGAIPKRATGDNNFKGGPAILGDGGREEPYMTPKGELGVSPKRDTLYNLPKGTKIWKSQKAFEKDIPHFAKGTKKNRSLTPYQKAAERRRKARERATARRKANTAYTRRVSDKIANARTDYKTGDISGKTYIKRLKAINKHYKTTAAQTRQIRLNIASTNKELKTQKTKFNKAIKDATSKYYDKVKDINQKAKDSIKDAKKTYSDALKSNRESAYNQVSLFDKAETEKASGSELFKNLKTQTAQQKDFMAQLNKLKKRGVNKSLIDELRNMGVSATGETKAIAGMSSSQLKAYQTEWKKKHTNANKLGLDMSAGDKTIMNNAIKAANAKAKRDLAAANKTWLKNLDKAKQYKAAGSKLGTQTVAGIISGFKKMDGPLAKQTSKLAKTITKTIKKRLKIHSPSRLMRDEVGAQVPAGVGVGMLDNLGTIHTASKKMQQMLTNSAPSLAVPVTPYTKDIAAYGSNGLKGEDSGSKSTIQPIKIINQTVLNGRVVAEETEEFITEIQDNKIKRMTRARGLTI